MWPGGGGGVKVAGALSKERGSATRCVCHSAKGSIGRRSTPEQRTSQQPARYEHADTTMSISTNRHMCGVSNAGPYLVAYFKINAIRESPNCRGCSLYFLLNYVSAAARHPTHPLWDLWT
jgi:hypothetical protein